jgi:hypothetical protein
MKLDEECVDKEEYQLSIEFKNVMRIFDEKHPDLIHLDDKEKINTDEWDKTMNEYRITMCSFEDALKQWNSKYKSTKVLRKRKRRK